MDEINQRTFLAIMLGALIKKLGGEVRLTEAELDALDASGRILPDIDPKTGDVVLRLQEGDVSVPVGTTLQ